MSDSDLENLKVLWDMCDCRIQPLSKEDGVPLLRMFLSMRVPGFSYQAGAPPEKPCTGQFFSQYTDERHRLGYSQSL